MLRQIRRIRSAWTTPRLAPRTPCEVRSTLVCSAALVAALIVFAPGIASADEPAPAGAPVAAPTAKLPPAPPASADPPASTSPSQYPLAPATRYSHSPGATTAEAADPAPYYIDPVTAAYLAEHNRELEEEREKNKDKEPKVDLPDSVKQTPEYRAARGQKVAGIVAVSVGGATIFGGAVLLISASLRNWGLFTPAEPDHLGQAGGAALMMTGALGTIIGGACLSLGRSEIRKIEHNYLLQGQAPRIDVNVGVGSVMVSASF